VDAAFYCMSSEAYFPGAVAMINSLRHHGHTERIYLLDLGLSPAHRELLATEARILDPPADTPPWLAKTYAPLACPAETMVLIDVDMVVTRPLGELISRAAEGRVLAFENNMDRFVPQWGEVLGLGRLERRPYVCSGIVMAGGEDGAEAVRLLDERQRLVDYERTYFARNDTDYPLLYLDQDVLNAVLQSRLDRERFEALPYRLAPFPPFSELELVDVDALRCAYPDGTEPYVVHQILPEKPWLDPVYDGVYVRLLKRMLTGDDVAIRMDPAELPLRLRRGPLAYAEQKRINLVQQVRWRLPKVTG
jgi:hypothetical protein